MSQTVERVGHPLFGDQWPNSKAAKVAAMLANGYSAPAIAAELNDGTSANAIRAMARHWGLTPKSTDPRHTYCDVSVPLAAKYRTKLAEEARKRGVEMPELMAQVMMTMCRDGLYSAILDN
ncbi:hypothetical protein [Pelagibacterium sp.]|uniref:hypothetical protein n=1 Tax=Pelagibacterium sp. TaxID=1967288 RepID=UPI003C7BC7AA